MMQPTDKEWSRFHAIREDLEGLPEAGVQTRIEQLREEGETGTVLSMLELHYQLARPPGLELGRCLAGRYTIREKIGEGGMGVVYDAVQELTQQQVALKVIHPALVSGPLIKRFLEEIRTLGRLQHDYIVRVFDADFDRDDERNQDILFYAMQRVEGLSLMRWVAEAHPTVDARLECFVHICDAVDYAHRCGVVHRDLKPDNILVDAAGRPAILDFGLAQVADVALDRAEGTEAAESATLLRVSGTPAFMSPERWDGRAGGVGADVFALGVVLHQIVTGGLPWGVAPEASIQELRKAICGFRVEDLRNRPGLGGSLGRLVGRMLEPEPSKRLAAAAEVASLVRGILVRRRFRRRVRRLAPLGAGVMVAVGTAMGFRIHLARLKKSMQQAQYQLLQAKEVVQLRDRADLLDRVAGMMPPPSLLSRVRDRWRDVVAEALSGWNLRVMDGVELPAGFEPVAGDGQGVRFFGKQGDGVWVLQERSGVAWEQRTWPGGDGCQRARVNPNPRRSQVAVLRAGGGLELWEGGAAAGSVLLPGAAGTSQFEFSPKGRYLACSEAVAPLPGQGGERLSRIHVFDTATQRKLASMMRTGDEPEAGTSLYLRSRPVKGLAFSPDGTRLAVWSGESSYLLVWRWEAERLECFARHTGGLVGAAWRPESESGEIATIQADGWVRVWKLGAGPGGAAYLDHAGAEKWGENRKDFQGELHWVPCGRGVVAVDEVRRRLDVYVAGGGLGGLHVPMGGEGEGTRRWLSGGWLSTREAGSEWAPVRLVAPARRVFRPDRGPDHLAFSPGGDMLVVADSTGFLTIGVATGASVGTNDETLSGPVAFDAVTGALWAYEKIKGPVRWTKDAPGGGWQPGKSFEEMGLSLGVLAAQGGQVVFSRGEMFSVATELEMSGRVEWTTNISVRGPPDRLAVSGDGSWVGQMWVDPVQALLWGKRADGGWEQQRQLTNCPVVAGLPEWNRASPLEVRSIHRYTPEEKALGLKPVHCEGAVCLVPALRVPMVAWLRDADEGVHLDFFGKETCIHVARLPFDHDQGVQTSLALSPDGMCLAVSNTSGEVHIWDLRVMLQEFWKLGLGIEETDLNSLVADAESARASTAVDPGTE